MFAFVEFLDIDIPIVVRVDCGGKEIDSTVDARAKVAGLVSTRIASRHHDESPGKRNSVKFQDASRGLERLKVDDIVVRVRHMDLLRADNKVFEPHERPRRVADGPRLNCGSFDQVSDGGVEH